MVMSSVLEEGLSQGNKLEIHLCVILPLFRGISSISPWLLFAWELDWYFCLNLCCWSDGSLSEPCLKQEGELFEYQEL